MNVKSDQRSYINHVDSSLPPLPRQHNSMDRTASPIQIIRERTASPVHVIPVHRAPSPVNVVQRTWESRSRDEKRDNRDTIDRRTTRRTYDESPERANKARPRSPESRSPSPANKERVRDDNYRPPKCKFYCVK